MPASSAEVVVNVPVPICRLTSTSVSVPVSPLMMNPAAFSAMLIALSPEMASRFRDSAPAGCTVIVKGAVASL